MRLSVQQAALRVPVGQNKTVVMIRNVCGYEKTLAYRLVHRIFHGYLGVTEIWMHLYQMHLLGKMDGIGKGGCLLALLSAV